MTDSEKLDLILTEMQGMKSEIQEMKSEMDGMKADLQNVKEKVVKMDLILENEIRVNIQRVAEGHLDLSRNLHEAMSARTRHKLVSHVMALR